MILIWGTKGYLSLVGFVMLVCGRCHTPAAQRIERLQRKFTLFFIPLFAYRTTHLMTCTFCGGQVELPEADAVQLAAQGRAQGAGPVAHPTMTPPAPVIQSPAAPQSGPAPQLPPTGQAPWQQPPPNLPPVGEPPHWDAPGR